METSGIQKETEGEAESIRVPEEIIFDTDSGISIEEQEEILKSINTISGGKGLAEDAVVTPKNKHFFFPLLVNAGAVVILVLGILLLFLVHGKDEQSIRDSSATLGLTERKLIQEIRRETNRQLNEKENEINGIMSKLSAAGEEYRLLQGSVESLTEEQQERAAYLLRVQEEYRSTLTGLEDEKAQILEASRRQEVLLRKEAEEKVSQLSSQVELGRENLVIAMDELRKLSAEQDRIYRADSQMAVFYSVLNEEIGLGQFDEAAKTLATAKQFINAPLLSGRQNYYAALSAIEAALLDAVASKEAAASATAASIGAAFDMPESSDQDDQLAESLRAAEASSEDLKIQNATLEQKVSSLERDIAALSSLGSDQGKVLAEYAASIRDLEARTVNQQETLNRRDNEIVLLRSEGASKDQQLLALNTNVSSLRAQLQTAVSGAAETENALALQRRENTGLSGQLDEIRKQRDDLQTQYDQLSRNFEDLQSRMDAAVRAFQGGD